MNLNRRQFLASALGAVAAAALGTAALAADRAGPGGGGTYAPIRRGAGGAPPLPPQAPLGATGDMIMQTPDGRWMSHLLPFAAPFPDEASVHAELAQSRALGLFR
jgi:hypothetical protein